LIIKNQKENKITKITKLIEMNLTRSLFFRNFRFQSRKLRKEALFQPHRSLLASDRKLQCLETR